MGIPVDRNVRGTHTGANQEAGSSMIPRANESPNSRADSEPLQPPPFASDARIQAVFLFALIQTGGPALNEFFPQFTDSDVIDGRDGPVDGCSQRILGVGHRRKRRLDVRPV